MPKAVGIGGLFFRAANPAGLAEWYQKHLGIDDLHKSVWRQEAGMTYLALSRRTPTISVERSAMYGQFPRR